MKKEITISKRANAIKNILLVILLVPAFLYALSASPLYKRDDCPDRYSFIDPRFACSEAQVVNKANYTATKEKISALIEDQKELGKVDAVSVYFRDLENGPTFGIEETRSFVPASLLKLPNVMTLFRIAEDDPSIMERTLTVGSVPPRLFQEYEPKEDIVAGRSYTLGELFFHSLAYSDNTADQVIVQYIEKVASGTDPVSETYRALGIFTDESDLDTTLLSTKQYASLFRLLYNASFLNDEASENILSVMSKSTFDEGLRAGVPSEIVLAHKFGERVLEDGKRELHDCGIIYYPRNPYLLCVMTKGESFADLEEMLSSISAEVFEEFNSRKIP